MKLQMNKTDLLFLLEFRLYGVYCSVKRAVRNSSEKRNKRVCQIHLVVLKRMLFPLAELVPIFQRCIICGKQVTVEPLQGNSVVSLSWSFIC